MYKILDYNYKDSIATFTEICSYINAPRKMLLFKDGALKDTFNDKSDILVYYDILDDTPLLLVERIDKKDLPLYSILKRYYLSKIYKMYKDGYLVAVDLSTSGYVDIVVLKSSIYKKIMG